MLATTVGRAWAAPCAGPDEPWVDLDSTRSELGPEASLKVLEQLRAGLRRLGIAVCAGAERPPHAPIARVALESRSEAEMQIDVSIADALTDKRVSRAVGLAGLPRDAWPLSLALATDEVLRASWAELALESAPAPKRPVPPAVTRAVAASLRPEPEPPPSPGVGLGVRFVADAFGAGTLQAGMDAHFGVWLTERLFAELSAGIRSAASVSAADGEVRSRAWVIGAGPGVSITEPSARAGLEALVRGVVYRVSFVAEPEPGARGRDASGTAAFAQAGARAYLAPDPSLRLSLEVALGAPLRGVRAADSNEAVVGLDGAQLSVALGFGGVF